MSSSGIHRISHSRRKAVTQEDSLPEQSPIAYSELLYLFFENAATGTIGWTAYCVNDGKSAEGCSKEVDSRSLLVAWYVIILIE